MKRAIIIFLIFIILFFLFLIFYKCFSIIKSYNPDKVDYEYGLSYYDDNLQYKLLNRLKYKIKRYSFYYNKSNYNIIVVEDSIKSIEEWKNWVKNGKRLIFLVNNNFSNINIKNIPIKSKDNIFDGIKTLAINIESKLDIKSNNLDILLKQGKSVFIAREKINQGEIIYISDSFIFSDRLLFEEDNAKFLNNLLKPYFNDIIVFDKIKTFEKESPKKSFLDNVNFRFFLIHLLILILIFFLTEIKRFGNPIEKDTYKNRAIDRHIDAVANFFYNCKNKNVLTKILDQFFYYRIRNILRYNNEDELLKKIKTKFGIKEGEEFIFEKDNIKDILNITINRERYIRKILKRDIY